ncbi:MAG: NifU family protein, partial [Bacteroidota bacterium]
EFNYAWEDIMIKLKEYIKDYLSTNDGDQIVKEGFTEVMAKAEAERVAEEYSGDDAELVRQIKELIDTYVKPAVEMDGGNIEFKSYKEGVVTVIMQGACSGCPSSTVTLKSGIEGMMKRMVPQVKEVVQEMA